MQIILAIVLLFQGNSGTAVDVKKPQEPTSVSLADSSKL